MADVIEFPAGPDFDRRYLERKVEEAIGGVVDPAVTDCIKERLAAIMTRYRKLPTMRLALALPAGTDEPTIKALTDEISAQYLAAVRPFVEKILIELCLAEANLCNCRFQRK